MTFDEAQGLQLAGRYSELLRGAVREQVQARERGNRLDETAWTIWIVKACRYIGRVEEGLAHAAHAVEESGTLNDGRLQAEAFYAQALMLKAASKKTEALQSLDRAVSVLPVDAPPVHPAIFDLERAELELELGNHDAARAALARGSAQVHWLENGRLLAWALYLRSYLDTEWPAELQLVAARTIAERVPCPELEWQILWRLALGAGRALRPGLEEDLAGKALERLKSMAEGIQPEDEAAFWRLASRASFLDYGRGRFGASFGEKLPKRARAWEFDARSWMWDPELLPSFVRVG